MTKKKKNGGGDTRQFYNFQGWIGNHMVSKTWGETIYLFPVIGCDNDKYDVSNVAYIYTYVYIYIYIYGQSP